MNSANVAREELLLNLILGPVVSEKTNRAQLDSNQVTFKVRGDATKPQIKAAVEKLFEVEVEQVRVLNVKGKVKMLGRRQGKRSDWKKAYVSLKDGSSIEMFAGG